MSIDRERIAADLAHVPAVAGSDGRLAVFGVSACRLPADLWYGFAQRLAGALGDELSAEAEELLAEAARESAYHLAYGVVTSEAWCQVVAPCVQRPPADTLQGACAVFAACGWPAVEIVDFVPGRRLGLRAIDDVPAVAAGAPGFDRERAIMARGMAAALMDLAYSPRAYPDGMGEFHCRGRAAAGVDRADFTAARA